MTRSEANDTDASGVAGLPARAAALRLLDAVLRQGQRLDATLPSATRGIELAEDRALALAIASEALRRLPDLDALIDSATAQPLAHDLKARSVLRIALVQALVLGTPPHAAIATALPLVSGGPRRLVHGVFGTVMRRGAALPDPPRLPDKVVARWRRWGYAMLSDAARALAHAPPLDVTLRNPGDDGGLGGESLAPGHRRLARGTAVTALPGYDEGKWWVQNLAASVPARLLGPGGGRSVLDLCAAPGGKTMQLAAQGWAVTAIDNHSGRLGRLRENLARTGLAAAVIEADILAWEPPAPVDAILLDAPCTSTGVFARHPDVLYRIEAADIAKLAALQARLLARAMTWLRPGGTLIYATCSLEAEEGEDIIAASGFARDPVLEAELPAEFRPDPIGQVRILPSPGLDGFFVARLKAA
ncbi:MAG: RsmB/NOP family class I SAM-dependent RNA methyltransferase [Sphingomonadaceae bacterium]